MLIFEKSIYMKTVVFLVFDFQMHFQLLNQTNYQYHDVRNQVRSSKLLAPVLQIAAKIEDQFLPSFWNQ